MRSLEVVKAEILGSVSALPPVIVSSGDALGLVLAETVRAAEAVPPFANTAMDGYALRCADTAGATEEEPVTLNVVGDLPAGYAPSVDVGAGEAVRIMTGAPIPDGADSIIPVERTSRDCSTRVQVHAQVKLGDHIRPVGGDVLAGDEVFSTGDVLGPASIGVLSSLAVSSVRVYPRPRVAVISTGDELVEGGGVLAPGQIRDSNRPMLLAMVRDAGCEAIDLGIARDDESALEAALLDAADKYDAIVTSGGVSVGDYDVVKAVLARIGVLVWSQVAIKPAKPLAFGVIGSTPIFGLPGNPVSSNISFELFARPALRLMAGHTILERPVVDAVATASFARRTDGKIHFDRVVVRLGSDGFMAQRSGGQGSNVLSAMAHANGLAILPDGDGVEPGGLLRVMLLTDQFSYPEGSEFSGAKQT